MNWKVLLPAVALLALMLPQQAWSRNHHFFNNNMTNPGQMPFNNGMGNGLVNHGQIPFNNGMMTNPSLGFNSGNPMMNTGMMNNGYMGNPLMGNGFMSNGLMGNGMLASNNGCQHRHKKRRRNMLTQLLSGQGLNNNGYGNYGNNLGYSSYNSNQYGGMNNGGLRALFHRI